MGNRHPVQVAYHPLYIWPDYRAAAHEAAVLFPVEHCARWEFGPWAPILTWFKDRPGLTRAIGVSQIVGSIAVAAGLSKSPGPTWVK